MSWYRILGSATLLAFVLSLGVGSVESAIPHSTNKKYYACFSKKTGAVRLINYPKVKKCGKGWRRRTWNAKGIPGGQGPAGPAGITRITLTQEMGPSVLVDPDQAGKNPHVAGVATCTAGKAVSGGHSSHSMLLHLTDSYQLDPTSWMVWMHNGDTAVARQFTPFVMCMTTDPGTVIASKKSDYGPANKAKKGRKKRR